MRFPFDLIVFDLETSGSENHRVIEIGAVRLDPELREIDRWSSLVDGRPVTDEVIKIHRITNEMLAGQKAFAEVHPEFDEWCAKSSWYLLSAFGAYFDVPVLRAEYDRIGVKYPHRGETFDIKAVVWWDLVGRGMPCRSLKLDRALELYGLKFEGVRHRGLTDAVNEARLLRAVAGRKGV